MLVKLSVVQSFYIVVSFVLSRLYGGLISSVIDTADVTFRLFDFVT